MRIAIVRLTSLGDIIFSMIVLQLIRRHFPGSSITWFADSKFADILDYNPDLSDVVKISLKGLKKDFSFSGLAQEYGKVAAAGKFDLALDLHGMIKSAVIARKVGNVTCGFHRSVVKEPIASLLYDRTFAPPPTPNFARRYATLTTLALGIPFDEEELVHKEPYLFHGENDALATASCFIGGRKNILLFPGTSAGEKNYPQEKWVSLVKTLGENLLVCHGNDGELRTGEYIAERTGATVLPRLNLNQLKAAVSRADLVIGGDTGPTHMAWASNVPSIALFGPTPPCFYPTRINRIVEPGGSKDGRNRRDAKMADIDELTILRLAEELLDR